jgi:glutamate-1-semialdehyde 2,1-aminomutase
MPGGTQLLSKRSEQFLPDQWPSYYKKAKGVYLWDMDGNKLLDMSLMGVGACILGYADRDVNTAVKKVIDSGSMATLNSPEEVELAEIMLGLDPWAGSVRYARTGGEAMAIAIRIGRAFTGKDKVAFCGYHGWHDWYLSANLADDKNLDGHLLKGLLPAGVPRCLKGSSIPFNYNHIEELEQIVAQNDIGVIVMEPVRHHLPENGFLSNVRKIADKIGAVLIFDEVSSGWRINAGGAHSIYNVFPDICVYGKAISNGYPMAAVVGRSEVMDAAQTSFISSTYWTERIGPAAAIATIGKMVAGMVPDHNCKIGHMILDGWKRIGAERGMKVSVYPAIPSMAMFTFDYGPESQAMRTLFTQEMLKRGYLASSSVYVSYVHETEHVDKYLGAADEVFGIVAKAQANGSIAEMLKGPVAHDGFKRLT